MFHTIILFFFLLTIKRFDVKTRLSEDGQLPPFFLSSMAAIMQRYLDRSRLLHSLKEHDLPFPTDLGRNFVNFIIHFDTVAVRETRRGYLYVLQRHPCSGWS